MFSFFIKLISAAIILGGTLYGVVGDQMDSFDQRTQKKVDKSKTEILTIVHNFRNERNLMIKASDDKTSVQLIALKASISEARKDIRAILTLTKERAEIDDKKSFYSFRYNVDPDISTIIK